MRIVKLLTVIFILAFTASCSKSIPEPSLAGKWKITSAIGNDDRHWTGTFTLEEKGSVNNYTGLFYWDAVDGKSSGTDSITGEYNTTTKVLTMTSIVISGNIEPVLYTMKVTANGTVMTGTWTGSSDGSVEHPGQWSAEKQ